METTHGFRGDYSFLSNFYTLDKPMCYSGLVFQTNEHFYQAMKFDKGSELRHKVSVHPPKGLKKFVNMNKEYWRDDWDAIKLSVMRYGLQYKFSKHNPLLRNKLIQTDGVYLIEYNWWNDKFWGVSLKDKEGSNNLGAILMEIRQEILKEENCK